MARKASINIGELLSASIDLAQQAGKLIRDIYFSGDLQIQIKGFTANGVEDPLTQADLKSQQHIVSGLQNRWKDLAIVGEEQVEIPHTDLIPRIDIVAQEKIPEHLKEVPLEDVVVFIDPLDATREFTKGFVHCVITLIGIAIKGKPIAGVMFQPFVDPPRTVWGLVGLGVEGILQKSERDCEGLIIITTASHNNEKVDRAIKKIEHEKLIRAGGAGYKVLQIIENNADLYLFPTDGCKLWDVCAPQAILNALGGTLTDSLGREILYYPDSDVYVRDGVVATMKNHELFIRLINS